MKLEGKKINFLGDSITEGCGTSGREACFTELLKNKYQLAAARNYGIGGTRYARQIVCADERVDTGDFCARALTMDPDADVVVVFGGTNDYGHGDAPFGKPEDRTEMTFCGACHVLFSGLITKYPDKTIVILTPMHRMTEQNKAPGLRAFVQAEREVAEYYSLPVLDLWARLGIQPLVPAQKALYLADMVHPNDAGHEKIACTLKRFLENL